MIHLEQLTSSVKVLAKEVGGFLREEWQGFSAELIETKGLNDLVSYVDKEAEKRIINGLKPLIPKAGFIAEEGTGADHGETYRWIVDPLDGTTNFIHGIPVFAVSIGLLYQGQIVLGVIYEVGRDECFSAYKGGGAYMNDQPISVSSTAPLSKALMSTGFPYYDFEKMDNYMVILQAFMQSCHGVRRMGSAAVDLAYVACGRVEGFFEYNLNAWDIAAGIIICQEAGGVVTDFKGGDDFLFGREIIAANKGVHGEVLDKVRTAWNGERLN